jgi:hypothetical protein
MILWSYVALHVTCPLFLSHFNRNWETWKKFWWTSRIWYCTKIRPARVELFHADRRTYGRTEARRLIVAFRNCFASAPKGQLVSKVSASVYYQVSPSYNPARSSTCCTQTVYASDTPVCRAIFNKNWGERLPRGRQFWTQAIIILAAYLWRYALTYRDSLRNSSFVAHAAGSEG